MSHSMMKMLSGACSSSGPGRTSVTNISASTPSAPGCSFCKFLCYFSSIYSDTLQGVCYLTRIAMDKVFVQQMQEKAEKLAPSNNTFSRTENICFCGSQDILRIVCLDVFSFTRVQQERLNFWPIRKSHGSMFQGGRIAWIHICSKCCQINLATESRKEPHCK